MTIYKPLKQLATRATETAVRMARGQPIVASAEIDNGRKRVPSILLEVLAVTRDNLESTVIADGLHAREAIFRQTQPLPQP